ncbi:MAG: hypothetical protein ACP5I4_12955 [Oceanipulchritudo sp.]
MSLKTISARHVLHVPTSGTDRLHAWREATGEPFFVWGTGSGEVEGSLFLPVKAYFRRWLEATGEASLTIYHDGAGSDALGPMDPCPAKVFFLHQWFPRWENHFEWLIRCTGKVLVGHPDLAGRLGERFAWVPKSHVQAIRGPVVRIGESLHESGHGGKPRTGIWLHGIPWRRHGNRLRAILDRWSPEQGELEVVANGRARPRWSRGDSIVWSMNLPFQFALYRLFTWDSVLLVNDFSLDAPWFLRALELGCFPLVPQGEGIARTHEWQAPGAPQPYPWGDIGAAQELLRQWRTDRKALLPAFREWVATTRGHDGEPAGFSTRWKSAKEALLAHRAPALKRRKPAPAWYPVPLYERIQRLRAGL